MIIGRKEPLTCWFKLQNRGRFGHFSYLLPAFEAPLQAGRTVDPIERTVLITGVLDSGTRLMARGVAEQDPSKNSRSETLRPTGPLPTRSIPP